MVSLPILMNTLGFSFSIIISVFMKDLLRVYKYSLKYRDIKIHQSTCTKISITSSLETEKIMFVNIYFLWTIRNTIYGIYIFIVILIIAHLPMTIVQYWSTLDHLLSNKFKSPRSSLLSPCIQAGMVSMCYIKWYQNNLERKLKGWWFLSPSKLNS